MKLLFLTGTRADFGKLKPLILGTQAKEEYDITVFVTGMHLLKAYGSTHLEVKRAGVKKIFNYINQHDNSTMDEVLSNTITGVSNYLRENEIDAIVIHGDRVEALAGAISGALNNIKVIHIEGGERSGTIDDSIRHAITKFSHLHFVSSETAEKRLHQLGENTENVYNIGSPNIDVMLSDELPPLDEVKKRYDIAFDEYCILIFHPVTTETRKLNSEISEVLGACEESKMNFVVIMPNNDFGADIIRQQYSHLSNMKNYCLLPSMRFEFYLTLLKHSQCIIGNSSSGIYESPVFGVPTINIGSRQDGRLEYESIINCNAVKEEILPHLVNLRKKIRFNRCNVNGDGNSLKKFLEIMDSLELDKVNIQKKFVDLV